ncbi:hypothetical protein [Lysinibacter sp. HNR]|uniref:hypothetical protein n=1 Tax=Lysinibacter sp. HNR TaxID=3031408 RepID=UPI002435B4A8|nr:hypothetical protein [Lysinibacter sp. HNR]WGD36765.1 hypothetical protein FrondiHNR_09895 [Lysinibacter sp. HNR]
MCAVKLQKAQKQRLLTLLAIVGVMGIVAVVANLITVSSVSHTSTEPTGVFNPEEIISDAKFFDSETMTAAQIQEFLNSQVVSCETDSYCLRNYHQQTDSLAAGPYCGKYSGSKRESAANIIYKVSRACGINPQVILVMLQKEQGLITNHNPTERNIRVAMGYSCPDSAPCNEQYYGFLNQVYQGAQAFNRYAANPSIYSYRAHTTNNIQYHPNHECGFSPIYIKNQATAGLYIYTPYQPNQAALDAGLEAGDGCSSYGNRNFYYYFTQWFGSPTAPNSNF